MSEVNKFEQVSSGGPQMSLSTIRGGPESRWGGGSCPVRSNAWGVGQGLHSEGQSIMDNGHMGPH